MIKSRLQAWFGAKESRRIGGYLYAPQEKLGPMVSAMVGAIVRNKDRGPPWLVVNHDAGSVILAEWPGRLWRVEVVDPVSAADGATPLIPEAGYTRAVAVNVLDEVPVEIVFGANGKAICSVIQVASELKERTALHLAGSRHADAGNIYSRAWTSWLTRENRRPHESVKNLDGTLGVSGHGSRSPIGSGLTLVHNQLSKRARFLWGDRAFTSDDDSLILVSPWGKACQTLLDAALAFGAPDLFEDSDREKLLKAWNEVVGIKPP